MQMTILQALLREVSKIHWTELLLHVFKLLAHLYYNQFQLTIKNYFGFPGGLVVKNLPASAGATGDTSSIPELGRYPGVRNGH